MVTIPSALLKKVCSFNGGTNGDRWYCNDTSKDLVINYSIKNDTLSISTLKEVNFCYDYKRWYEKQFCGPVAKDIKPLIAHIRNNGKESFIDNSIPSASNINSRLINALPSDYYRTKLSVEMDTLTRIFHEQMIDVSDGKIVVLPNADLIHEQIVQKMPSRYRKKLRPLFYNAAMHIEMYYKDVEKNRRKWLDISSQLVNLDSKVSNQCVASQSDEAREINNYCNKTIGMSQVVSKSKFFSAGGGGAATLLNLKKIWKGVRWLWTNKNKIASTFILLGKFIKRMGGVWSKGGKGGGGSAPPANSDKGESVESTKREGKVSGTANRDITDTAELFRPDKKVIQNQLSRVWGSFAEKEAVVQQKIARLALDQWIELSPQKKARFINSDDNMPPKGELPKSFMIDFIQRTEESPFKSATAELKINDAGRESKQRISTENSDEGARYKTVFEDVAIELPKGFTNEDFERASDFAARYKVQIEDAVVLVGEGNKMWKELSHDQKAEYGGGNGRPATYDYYQAVLASRKVGMEGGGRTIRTREERKKAQRDMKGGKRFNWKSMLRKGK